MKKDHLAESTIKVTDRRLRLIAKTVNLKDPDKVTEYLANKKGKSGYIDSLTSAYERYTRYNEIFWEKPCIKRSSSPPYVPTTEETSILIANAGTKYCIILSVLRDTGLRPIELERSKLKWFDLQRGMVNIETAKGGNPRSLKLKTETLSMLKTYIAKNNFNLNDHIFPKVISMNKSLQRIRNRAAQKLKRPELRRICLYSFRHYFATMLYHKTKDILHVKGKMGHRNLKNTFRTTL